ncbi:hypothetical protein BT67DRAFT_262227 [Trichocladium antarcticum]|uniref:Uncharacterized protein n=1 Tax=Trichocladium antarcticum TaxID=1450529 RepID=A0AAN6ZE74_9PEZI|nr:hypothetical protein BT67DRAFT_262227 [Trichocladium antarcticum]
MPTLQPNLGSFGATASLQVAWPFSGGQTGCREASCACRPPSLPPVTRGRCSQWAAAPGRLAASRWAITSPMPSLPPVASSSNHQVRSNRRPHRIDRGSHQSLGARTLEGHADGRTCIVFAASHLNDPMRVIAVRCNGDKPMIVAGRRPRESRLDGAKTRPLHGGGWCRDPQITVASNSLSTCLPSANPCARLSAGTPRSEANDVPHRMPCWGRFRDGFSDRPMPRPSLESRDSTDR